MRPAIAAAVLSLLVGLAWARSSPANDSAFRGAPADLVPLRQTPVRMRSEAIVLTATHAEWSIEARYEFSNPTATAQRLTVGFPELYCLSDTDYHCSHRHFRDFKTWVDGREVTHRQGKLAPNEAWSSYLGVIWLYEVTFPANGSVSIEHRYRLQTGKYSIGERFTDYVTRTGRPWAGSIGHARFTARLPPYAHAVAVSEVKGLTLQPPRVVDGPTPHVELVLEGRDWEPESDIQFRFDASTRDAFARLPTPSSASDLFALIADTSAEGTLELLRLIHAAKGYPFRSQALRRQFYGGSAEFHFAEEYGRRHWVRGLGARQGFDRSWFDHEDHELLAVVEKNRRALGLDMDLQDVDPASAVNASAPPSAPSPPVASAAPPARLGIVRPSGCRCEIAETARSRGEGIALAALSGLLVASGLRRRRPR